MLLVSLKESHVARGVDVVSFSFSPDSISRNQRSREITLNFFSIDRFQFLPAWGSTRRSMSQKGKYVYKFCVCDFVMEIFGGVVLNKSERVKKKSKTASRYICLFLS